ncbi:MAG: hypothetical protein WC489_07245 [Patescibacteria group bacterium]|jgi:hypothetical protein
MVWYEDLAPRGRNNVTISTTVSRDKAAQLDKIGDWLLVTGQINKNTSYRCAQYAIDLMIELLSKQAKR